MNYVYYPDYLEHHGILGMKWGIRRYQNPDGTYTAAGRARYGRDKQAHTISKGTIVYRTSANEDGSVNSKHMYVTYTDVDRALYSGTYSKTLAKNQTGDINKQMYESSYKLKEDLRVPSKETVDNLFKKMANDKTSVEETSLAQAGAWFVAEHFEYDASDNYWNDLMKKGKDPIADWDDDEYHKYIDKEGEKWAKQHMKQFKDMPVDDILLETAQSLGASDYNREKVISELKKMGYNAMVDEAGVGYKGQEGIEPLIIFDKDASVEKQLSSRKLTDSSMKKSDKVHNKWQKKQL